jgi:hypothetical protein
MLSIIEFDYLIKQLLTKFKSQKLFFQQDVIGGLFEKK